MNRIILIGSGGSGKTTLARRLGRKLGIETFHLDTLLWRPGWTLATREEQIALQRELVRGERWIIDGNYGGTLGIRMAAADTIILLDFPPLLCLWRVIRRRLSYLGRTRPDMAEGCVEGIWLSATDREFFSRVRRFRRKGLPSIMRAIAEYGGGKQVITIRSKGDIEAFLAGLTSTHP